VLFKHLPDLLFSPLAGPNREIYARIIADLHPLFFGEMAGDVFPVRDTVLSQMEESLSSIARVRWVDEEGDEPLDSDSLWAHSQRIYRRLVRCGWLDEEKEGYQVRTTVPPPVGALLSALLEIAENRKLFYGGIVLSIYNNVRNAHADPENQAAAFHQACVDGRKFQQHLGGMVYGLKGLLKTFHELPDRKRLLARFFDDFVENFLIGDYTTLKTEDNPFRFRGQILRVLQEIRFDADIRKDFVSGYLKQLRHGDPEAAQTAFERDLASIITVFEGIDTHLDRIDRYRYRFERRAANTVRYMDRTEPGMAARLARLLQAIAELDRETQNRTLDERLHALVRPRPLSRKSPSSGRAERSQPAVSPLRARKVDPQELVRQQVLQRFLLRRRIDPSAVANYLDRQLTGRLRIEASEFAIETAEDLLNFAHARYLKFFGSRGERLANQYEIRLGGETISNQWMRCRNFIVQRRRPHTER
jgi:hypothetical protein